ncbi:hypothetical protein HYFRA_00003915 [Hymenoscyphus fraxineus]|uniref:Uncharacterized protein n=1 Tax=Hymenoscyphus fraxineus TaxID=746836 RepID=A0A9N9PVB8_9HELO|nr:hypothetical protein HYFRA_00003915 [Hymenoscyphus fraxineus]
MYDHHPSSPDSFYSAVQSPEKPASDHEMTDVNDTPVPAKRYRPSKSPAREIQQHCHIFFDESLYHSALSLLSDLVTAGASHPDCLNRPAITPIPFHIELVSALLIHPRWTTHLLQNESADLPARAITLLRNILSILGPINANLGEAFSFSEPERHRPMRGGRPRHVAEADTGSSSSEEERPDRMLGVIANGGRLRRCAKDFWHVVGWAFNCSVKYPKRWQYWKVWLEFMFDVLHEDYEERKRLDLEKHERDGRRPNQDPEYSMLRNSLLLEYLVHVKGRTSALKRVARSIFANGQEASLREFPEVYPNETRVPKDEQGQKRKREDSMQEANFGDYNDEMGDDAFESPKSSLSDDEGEEPEADLLLGGTESIALRQCIVKLLSQATADISEEFTDTVEYFDSIYECTKVLPNPAFSLFLSPSRTSQLPVVVQISLIQLSLLRLLPNNAPIPAKVLGRSRDEVTQEVLEKCYLPFPAMTSSVDDNTKLSILIENIFRIYVKQDGECYHTPVLDHAIEKGIKARENKIKDDRKKKSAQARKRDDADRAMMRASAERLRSLFKWIEHKNLAHRRA